MVTFGKKPKRAIAVNGQIPMPTLTFTEGDTAEIWVHNQLKGRDIPALAWLVFAQQNGWCSLSLHKCLLSQVQLIYTSFPSFSMAHIGITAIAACRNK